MWALFLLLPGVLGLGIQHAQKNALQARIDQAAQRIADSTAAQEYLDMYKQWSDLPGDEKANNPWGYGSYGGSDIQRRLHEHQPDQLLADMLTLKEGFSHYPDELAEILYGPQWQQGVASYQEEEDTAEMVLIISVFLAGSGCLALGGGLTKWIIMYVMKKRAGTLEDPELQPDEAELESEDPDEAPAPSEALEEPLPPSPFLTNTTSRENEGYFQSSKKTSDDTPKPKDLKATELPMRPVASVKRAKQKEKDSYFGWAVESDGTVKHEAHSTSEPLTKELTELTEEVSAIREFASQQQDQVRKLQDGYDWMIIRRFCLRIIRCIDNIDDRIAHAEEQGEGAVTDLQDIRDELVFSMEASGVEQFKPNLNIPFKGLEKYAEAVRERIDTEDSDLVGCIAEITRPGYQYLVNDNDVKIVRCAQIKLYELTQP